jgi:hypothetical protein
MPHSNQKRSLVQAFTAWHMSPDQGPVDQISLRFHQATYPVRQVRRLKSRVDVVAVVAVVVVDVDEAKKPILALAECVPKMPLVKWKPLVLRSND